MGRRPADAVVENKVREWTKERIEHARYLIDVCETVNEIRPILEDSLSEIERLRNELISVAATAKNWAVANGGDTPLAIIAQHARDALGMTLEEVDAIAKDWRDKRIAELDREASNAEPTP